MTPSVASCLNDACRHVALIDVSKYPADTEVPWFRSRVVCAKCGGRGNKIDVRLMGKSNRRSRASSHQHRRCAQCPPAFRRCEAALASLRGREANSESCAPIEATSFDLYQEM
jgi:hypothetical protein